MRHSNRLLRLAASLGILLLIVSGCAGNNGTSGANLNPNVLTGPTISPLLTGLSADQLTAYIAWFRNTSTAVSGTAVSSPMTPGPDGKIVGTPVILDPRCGLSYAYQQMASSWDSSSDGLRIEPITGNAGFFNQATQQTLFILQGYALDPSGGAGSACDTRTPGYLPIRLDLAAGRWNFEGFASPGVTLQITVSNAFEMAPLKNDHEIDDSNAVIIDPTRLTRFAVTAANIDRVTDYASLSKTGPGRRIYWFRTSDLSPSYTHWATAGGGATSGTTAGIASAVWFDPSKDLSANTTMFLDPTTRQVSSSDSIQTVTSKGDDDVQGSQMADADWGKLIALLKTVADTATYTDQSTGVGVGAAGGTATSSGAHAAAIKAVEGFLQTQSGVGVATTTPTPTPTGAPTPIPGCSIGPGNDCLPTDNGKGNGSVGTPIPGCSVGPGNDCLGGAGSQVTTSGNLILDSAIPDALGGWDHTGTDVFGVVADNGNKAYSGLLDRLKDSSLTNIEPLVGFVGLPNPGDSPLHQSSVTISPSLWNVSATGDAAQEAFYNEHSFLFNASTGTLTMMAFSTDDPRKTAQSADSASANGNAPGIPYVQGPLTSFSFTLSNSLDVGNSATYTSSWVPTLALWGNGPKRGIRIHYDPLFQLPQAVSQAMNDFVYNVYSSTLGALATGLSRSATTNLLSVPAIDPYQILYYNGGMPVYAYSSLVVTGRAPANADETYCTAIVATPGFDPGSLNGAADKCLVPNGLYVLWGLVRGLSILLLVALIARYFYGLLIQGPTKQMKLVGFLARVFMAMGLIFGMNVIISLLSRIVAETILITDMFGSQLSGGAPYSHLWLFANYLSAPNQDAGVFLLLLLAPFAIVGLFILLIVNWLRIGFSIVIILLSPIWIISLMADPSMRLFYTGLKTMLRLYLIPLTSLVVLLALFLIGRMLGIDASQGGDAVGAIVGMLMLIALAIIPIFLSKYVVVAPMNAVQGMITASLKAADTASLNRVLAQGMEGAHPKNKDETLRADLDDPRFAGHDKLLADSTLAPGGDRSADAPPALEAGTGADAGKLAAAEISGDLANPAGRGGPGGEGGFLPPGGAPAPGSGGAGDSGYSAGGPAGDGTAGAGGYLPAGGAGGYLPAGGAAGVNPALGSGDAGPLLGTGSDYEDTLIRAEGERADVLAQSSIDPWDQGSRRHRLWSTAGDLARLGAGAAVSSTLGAAVGSLGESARELKKEAKDTLYAVDAAGQAHGLLAQPGGVLSVLTGTAFVGGAKAGGTLDQWEKKYVSANKPFDRLGGSRPVSAARARLLGTTTDWGERNATKARLREEWRAQELGYRQAEQATSAAKAEVKIDAAALAIGHKHAYDTLIAVDERLGSGQLDAQTQQIMQNKRAQILAKNAAWAQQYEDLRGRQAAAEANLAAARSAAQAAFVSYDAATAAPPFMALVAPRRAIEARLVERSEHKQDVSRFSRAIEIRDSLRSELENLESRAASNDSQQAAKLADLRVKLARTEQAVGIFSERAAATTMDAELAARRREERSQVIDSEITAARQRISAGHETLRSLEFLAERIDRDVRAGRLEPAAAERHRERFRQAEQVYDEARATLAQLRAELERLA